MKRLIALLVCAMIIAMCFASVPVAAAEQACYIVPEGVEIRFVFENVDYGVFPPTRSYADFVVPYGYTITVTSVGDVTAIAEFGGIKGLVSKEDLDKLTISPSQLALPEVEVTVDDKTVYRFVDGNRQSYDIVDGQRLLYLGTFTHNTVAYYAVRIEGDANFIYYAQFNHSNHAEVDAAVHPKSNSASLEQGGTGTTDAVATPRTDTEFTWVRFVLILGIIVPLITIVFMIVRPRGRARRAHREIYDGDDDYDGIDEV